MQSRCQPRCAVAVRSEAAPFCANPQLEIPTATELSSFVSQPEAVFSGSLSLRPDVTFERYDSNSGLKPRGTSVPTKKKNMFTLQVPLN